MAQFKYQARGAADWEKRAVASRFVNYYLDEFKTFAVKKDNSIRILPPTWDNARHFGFDIWLHYSVGPDNGCVICNYKMMTGKGCPICEAQGKAEAAGNTELAKSLKPTRRVLVWVVDRKEPQHGPQLWAMPWTGDRDLAIICKDRGTGELFQIDHPDAGFDIYFDRTGELPNVKYVGWQLARRPSSVEPQWLEYIAEHPLPTTLHWRTYEEVSLLFEGQSAAQASAQPEPTRTVADANQNYNAPAPVTASYTVAKAGFCEKSIVFRGEKLLCGKYVGHTDPCDFSREEVIKQLQPEPEPEHGPCQRTFVFKGTLLGCSGVEGHEGDCQFDVDLGPTEPPPVQVAAVAAAPPERVAAPTQAQPQRVAIASRADAMKARFSTGPK